MHGDDVSSLEHLIRLHPEIGTMGRVLVLSPENGGLSGLGGSEANMIRRIWDGAVVEGLGQAQWDLMEPCPQDTRWDMVVACNTFMCAVDPGRWLRNIAAVCDFIAIQDLSTSKRNGETHCDPKTGDVARYSISSHGIIGETDPGLTVFDFSTSGYRVIDAQSYGQWGKFVILLDLRVAPGGPGA